MIGPIALHGGGEFQAGDELFLQRLLELATERRGRPVGAAIRILIVPTAAARGRPGLVGAHGVAAFERVAATGPWPDGRLPLTIDVEVVEVVDATSAADPAVAERLAAADVIHLPGGDPDLIPTILGGTPAWAAIVAAHRRGAVLAGASAGAMALASWTWTREGGMPGLGLVPGIVVVPHASASGWATVAERFRDGVPAGLGLLGVGERTGAISRPTDPDAWDVVGEGEVRWLVSGGEPADAIVMAAGEVLHIPG